MSVCFVLFFIVWAIFSIFSPFWKLFWNFFFWIFFPFFFQIPTFYALSLRFLVNLVANFARNPGCAFLLAFQEARPGMLTLNLKIVGKKTIFGMNPCNSGWMRVASGGCGDEAHTLAARLPGHSVPARPFAPWQLCAKCAVRKQLTGRVRGGRYPTYPRTAGYSGYEPSPYVDSVQSQGYANIGTAPAAGYGYADAAHQDRYVSGWAVDSHTAPDSIADPFGYWANHNVNYRPYDSWTGEGKYYAPYSDAYYYYDPNSGHVYVQWPRYLVFYFFTVENNWGMFLPPLSHEWRVLF